MWSVFLSSDNEGSEVHYLKREAKQSLIYHNLLRFFQKHLEQCCDEIIVPHLAREE